MHLKIGVKDEGRKTNLKRTLLRKGRKSKWKKTSSRKYERKYGNKMIDATAEVERREESGRDERSGRAGWADV